MTSLRTRTTFLTSSSSPELVDLVGQRLEELRERIARTGRRPDDVTIVAVTKTFDASYVRAAAACGLVAVGENYADELVAKRDELQNLPLSWHYLGHLQSNKIRRLAASADVISSVSRVKEIDALAGLETRPDIDVQVDYTGAEGRNGASPSEVANLVKYARDHGLVVRGLMTVAPQGAAASEAAFRDLDQQATALGLKTRSMGMSDDLELACRLGTTEIRVGRGLFGAREGGHRPDLNSSPGGN